MSNSCQHAAKTFIFPPQFHCLYVWGSERNFNDVILCAHNCTILSFFCVFRILFLLHENNFNELWWVSAYEKKLCSVPNILQQKKFFFAFYLKSFWKKISCKKQEGSDGFSFASSIHQHLLYLCCYVHQHHHHQEK